MPITLAAFSQISSKFHDDDTFELEYLIEGLIPKLEYKIEKLVASDIEIPFGERDYKIEIKDFNKPTRLGSKIFQTTFSKLSNVSLKNEQLRTGSPYKSEKLTLSLDPIAMWSLDGKKISVTFEPTNPDGSRYTGKNVNEIRKEFTITADKLKSTMIATLNQAEVTDESDGNFFLQLLMQSKKLAQSMNLILN